MKLSVDLEAEHALIEGACGALRTYVARRLSGGATVAVAPRFVAFFRLFVGGYHHDREEQVLFPALTSALGIPGDRGPLFALLAQHHELAAIFDALQPLLSSEALDEGERSALDSLSRRYAHGLWRHIDAENSVLLPESAARLARVGMADLPAREPTAEEIIARDDGARLVAEYPPVHDPSAMRGEGCVICPSYGVTCDGVERTWWNESEWDEFADQLG